MGYVTLTDDGFSVRADGKDAAVNWADVQQIVAFKRDLFSSDLICLAFALRAGCQSGAAFVELDESMEGFQELFGPLERVFGVSPTWYNDIMVPVFETKMTVLFERAGG